MFWDILLIISAVVLCILVISFIPVVVWVIGAIFGVDLSDRFEKKHPKIYKVIEKTITISLLALLFTFIPFAIHSANENLKEEHVYNVKVEDENIIITDKDGKTYTIIFQD